jgi:PAS domain S-box-containing protein
MVVTIITAWFVNRSLRTFDEQTEKNLELQTETLLKMFEREYDLKSEKVRNNLRVAAAMLGAEGLVTDGEPVMLECRNQLTGQSYPAVIRNWRINGSPVLNNNTFVDSLSRLLGGSFTIFQRCDSGFIRISTTITHEDGSRAVGTYIPFDSPVSMSVLSTGSYYGRAFVVNDWQITAYQLIGGRREVPGMLYTGDREKDLDELKRILHGLKIGISGYPFVFDRSGNFLIHPSLEGKNYSDSELFRQIKDRKSGTFRYIFEGKEKTVSFRYFPGFEVYVAASVVNDDETAELKHSAIAGAAFTAVLAILVLLVLLYYFTSDRIYRYFSEMQRSRQKLVKVSQELHESEERFRKLFDSTGDDIFVTNVHEQIVEVNASACETLGFSREELLEMKMTGIKSEKFRDRVSENRRIIYEKGSHVFESEHVTRSGKVIPVEFISRLVSYGNERLILSVVRNLSQRRELERQILSAVIQAEEKERSRFARDMHDGLGPLLSAIKLYVNELKSSSMPDEERQSLIQSCNEMIDDAVNSTRTISNNLMPRVIHQYGLVRAVEAFCEKVNRTNQLSISFETEHLPERLDPNLELILFRVISELINNTIKHAKAKTILILMVKKEGILSLYFRDDGTGFNADEIMQADNKGMGLKNIISRVKSINGTYYFSSKPGEGFSIKIEVTL